ncbi:Regulator of rDNA transcription protein 15 [Melia azedarach]|nr:Regulator of rDNA transcription protein 15 [Melia azedarach]
MPPGWDCLVRAPSWPASKPLLSRPGVFREWRLAAGHRAHCTLLAARARAVTPARTPPALPAPMCQRELSKDWPRLSSCGRGVNLCLAPRIARGASLLPRLAPERQPPSLPSLHPKGAVHGLASGLRARASNCRRSIRFSYSPSASLALRVRSVSCVAYPCEGIRRFRCSNPPCALPGAGWTRGVLRVPGVPCDTSHGRLGPRSSPVLSDAERYAWARGRLGLAVPKLRAFVLDANDCRARLDLAQRVVRGVGVAEECYLVDPASSHMLVSKIKPCMSRSWTLGWVDRFRLAVCTGRLVPSAAMRSWPLTGRVVASGAVTLKKLECSKQAYALDTLAWDNIIGFRSYSVGLRDRSND